MNRSILVGAVRGHAANAKHLLEQANEELRLAADVANEHERH
jgi:hypothetical protein